MTEPACPLCRLPRAPDDARETHDPAFCWARAGDVDLDARGMVACYQRTLAERDRVIAEQARRLDEFIAAVREITGGADLTAGETVELHEAIVSAEKEQGNG